jgi:hypothetical protein
VNNRGPARPSSVLVLRFYPGTSSFRTDIIHRDALGVEHLVHRHESTIERFGIDAFRAAVRPSIEAGIRGAIIDLVEVRWAPSEVIATLLLVEAFLRDGGVVCVVANPNSRVMSVLSVTGLIWRVKVRESMDEALDFLAHEAGAAGA